ncbi:hypothetical protein EJ06DRAFT_397275 [Trichodelitschia bisporula]|uniref:Uncharacterized protein n=1 Tax=Trichodelitschia bisporula TaxID=703511 RepID=A0A6G1HWZ7_9PEZI|nr:hypothetical protein EJ06DRAFT_397275 [Trichodelitschia bisporula]
MLATKLPLLGEGLASAPRLPNSSAQHGCSPLSFMNDVSVHFSHARRFDMIFSGVVERRQSLSRVIATACCFELASSKRWMVVQSSLCPTFPMTPANSKSCNGRRSTQRVTGGEFSTQLLSRLERLIRASIHKGSSGCGTTSTLSSGPIHRPGRPMSASSLSFGGSFSYHSVRSHSRVFSYLLLNTLLLHHSRGLNVTYHPAIACENITSHRVQPS